MKNLNYCSENLKKLDYYGIRPTLFFKGESVKGTGFGLFLTSILLILSISCLYYFGQNLFYHQRPFIQYHEEYEPYPEPFVLDPEKRPFFLEINDNDGVYLTDTRMLKVQISQSYRKNQVAIKSSSYDMEVCNETHIETLNNDSKEYFLRKNLSNFFCIPKHIKNLTIEGAYDQNVFKSIKISFSICKNQDYCLDSETIKSKLAGGFIGVFFVDETMDPGDFVNPKKKIPKEVFTNYVVKSQKEVDIYFKNSYLYSEQGLVFDDTHKDRIFGYDEFHDLNFMVESDTFLLIYLKMKQMKSIHERTYSKIQDLIGLLGGFLNFFYLIGYFLNDLYTKLAAITEILLEIFTIKVAMSKEIKIDENNRERLESEIPSPIKIDQIEPPNIDNETPLSTERQKLYSEPNQINLNILEGKMKQNELEIMQKYELTEINPELINEENNQIPTSKNKQNQIFKLPPKIIEQEDNEYIKNEEMKEKEEIKTKINLRFDQNSTRLNDPNIEIQEIMSLKFGFIDYLYYYTGLFKTPERVKKKLIVDKGMHIFENFLDVKFIIQKFYEFEKIKQLVLNEHELELFNFLPKPEIIVNYKTEKNIGKERKKHSVHTRVFMRSNSAEDIQVRKMTDHEKKKVLQRKITQQNFISNKFTSVIDFKINNIKK